MNIQVYKNGVEIFKGDLMDFLSKNNFNDILQNECIKLRNNKIIEFKISLCGELEGNWEIIRL